jgi:hypothetical protein
MVTSRRRIWAGYVTGMGRDGMHILIEHCWESWKEIYH